MPLADLAFFAAKASSERKRDVVEKVEKPQILIGDKFVRSTRGSKPSLGKSSQGSPMMNSCFVSVTNSKIYFSKTL